MKKIVCEICGSSNIIKKDGVFVCQTCGMKYFAEDVKKMLMEVKEPISDTCSTIDISVTDDNLDNLYCIARRAKDNDDNETAAKIYEQISIKNPKDWESAFFSSYFKYISIKIGEIRTTIDKFHKSSISALNLVKESKMPQNIDMALSEIADKYCDLMGVFASNSSNHYGKTRFNSIDDFDGEDVANYFSTIEDIGIKSIEFGCLITDVFGDSKFATKCCKFGIDRLYDYFFEHVNSVLGLSGLKVHDAFDPRYCDANEYNEEDFAEENIYYMDILDCALGCIEKLTSVGSKNNELNEERKYFLDIKNKLIENNNKDREEWIKKKNNPNYKGQQIESEIVHSSSINGSYKSNTPNLINQERMKHLLIGLVFLIGGIILGGVFDIIFLVRVYDGEGGNEAAMIWFFVGLIVTILGIIIGVINFKKMKKY